jgi:hypothetical protein
MGPDCPTHLPGSLPGSRRTTFGTNSPACDATRPADDRECRKGPHPRDGRQHAAVAREVPPRWGLAFRCRVAGDRRGLCRPRRPRRCGTGGARAGRGWRHSHSLRSPTGPLGYVVVTAGQELPPRPHQASCAHAPPVSRSLVVPPRCPARAVRRHDYHATAGCLAPGTGASLAPSTHLTRWRRDVRCSCASIPSEISTLSRKCWRSGVGRRTS